jgi:hypothetical protein
MNLDEFYKLLGYGLVSLFLLYIVAKSVRFQLGVVEGLVGYTKKDKAPAGQAQAEQAGQAAAEQAEQAQEAAEQAGQASEN